MIGGVAWCPRRNTSTDVHSLAFGIGWPARSGTDSYMLRRGAKSESKMEVAPKRRRKIGSATRVRWIAAACGWNGAQEQHVGAWHPPARRIAFQNPSLLPWLSLENNVAFRPDFQTPSIFHDLQAKPRVLWQRMISMQSQGPPAPGPIRRGCSRHQAKL